MGGGLLQLVAYGAQDAYITGNPQITFWKGLFKRHTNFAMEPFRINFSGQIQWGTKQTALVGRHADLLYSTYVEVVLPRETIETSGGTTVSSDYYWNNDQGALGFNLIKYVELDIGGQIIDRQYGEFLFLWAQLTSERNALDKTIDLLSGPCTNKNGASALTYKPGCGADGRQLVPNVLYIPLSFFFTRNPGAALPLIALQYHEVKINVLWNEPQFIAGNFTTTKQGNQPAIGYLPQAIQAALYIDYIYLDTEERRRMAQASHEYLIQQTQYNEDKGIVGANNRIDLTFNHPVKELIWVVQPAYYTDCRIAAGIDNNTATTVTGLEVISSNLGSSGAKFTVVYQFGTVATVTVTTAGTFYAVGQEVTVPGNLLPGGKSPANDLTFQVSTLAGSGIATVTFLRGTAPAATNTRLKPFTYDHGFVFDQWIQINGQDRLDRRYGDYFNRVQPFQHHSGNITASPGAYMYSFAIRPEEHQPSGTCNFSRIDTATIVMNMAGASQNTTAIGTPGSPDISDDPDYNNWNVRVYAVNYNVLRVMSGMGGLAYSN